MDLSEVLNSVSNRESFILFVRELIKDRRKAKEIEKESPETYLYGNASGWENTSVEEFLDGAVSWLEDSERKDMSWKLMAEFLYCGKIYE